MSENDVMGTCRGVGPPSLTSMNSVNSELSSFRILYFYCVYYVYNFITIITRMWANVQRDGRPAEYRWRPLLNREVWLTPTTRCRAVMLPRRENR